MVFKVANPRRTELVQFLILKHRKLLARDSALMAVVLAGLWKQMELSTERLSEELAWQQEAAKEDAPVRTKEMLRMLRRYGRRKLGLLKPAPLRAG